MGDDTNLPILCPQVRKTYKFKTLLLELRTGNYVVVTNLQIYHPTFYLLCDARTGTLQTVFLFPATLLLGSPILGTNGAQRLKE